MKSGRREDDLFCTKRLSTRLNKDLAAKLRAFVYDNGISMQELFETFALLVVTGDPAAQGVLDSIMMTKMKLELEKSSGRMYKNGKPIPRDLRDLSEPDANVIYDLLDGHDPTNKKP